ncbi:hypothetical protein YM304_08880 [Ilumatobacter coccineus YM16-304]|uniref:Uncharacterized protein n=1 Tax=Ilumatobacter coccineus (strain NBRC 103263 / KCTC 29153 / YM16-304) TaxID=1313172 RepID=A0A6C7E4U7_ILUCY|nr:hypothetical protein YM304_08880 [Ilumatobacter coccineus YM16-304]
MVRLGPVRLAVRVRRRVRQRLRVQRVPAHLVVRVRHRRPASWQALRVPPVQQDPPARPDRPVQQDPGVPSRHPSRSTRCSTRARRR